ncbi:MAG: phosphodiester glycosidase family protein [Candidatus Riflebacteria bacterium]|nr:phosphodiester glycosidase family protein [Candidatus Riflebacteria bacterium]
MKIRNYKLSFFVLANFVLFSSILIGRTPKQLDFLKPAVRDLCESFGNLLVHGEELAENNNSQSDLRIIKIPGATGIYLASNSFQITPYTWTSQNGLLQAYYDFQKENNHVLAAINGTFFSPTHLLGPIIVNGLSPAGIKQLISKHSRCFIAVYENSDTKTRWVLGETSASSRKILSNQGKDLVFNRFINSNEKLLHLIGGGGWIIRNGKNVHLESYTRQKLNFRKVDQDNRHSVIAMDKSDGLYLMVFDHGQNLNAVAEKLLNKDLFSGVTDAIFLDGGSSSAIVLNGNYLVQPLYFFDKSRFSALMAIKR